jgi:hypothetical protein
MFKANMDKLEQSNMHLFEQARMCAETLVKRLQTMIDQVEAQPKPILGSFSVVKDA